MWQKPWLNSGASSRLSCNSAAAISAASRLHLGCISEQALRDLYSAAASTAVAARGEAASESTAAAVAAAALRTRPNQKLGRRGPHASYGEAARGTVRRAPRHAHTLAGGARPRCGPRTSKPTAVQAGRSWHGSSQSAGRASAAGRKSIGAQARCAGPQWPPASEWSATYGRHAKGRVADMSRGNLPGAVVPHPDACFARGSRDDARARQVQPRRERRERAAYGEVPRTRRVQEGPLKVRRGEAGSAERCGDAAERAGVPIGGRSTGSPVDEDLARSSDSIRILGDGARCRRDGAEMQPKCSRGAAEVQPRYGAEMQPRSSVGESDYRFLGRG